MRSPAPSAFVVLFAFALFGCTTGPPPDPPPTPAASGGSTPDAQDAASSGAGASEQGPALAPADKPPPSDNPDPDSASPEDPPDDGAMISDPLREREIKSVGERPRPAATITCMGGRYRVGQEWKDDCNTCTCGPDGVAKCTVMACGPF